MFNILILEDEKNIRRLMEIKISNQGYNVISAEDGEVGLKKMYENAVDLIIVDAMMPNMNGYEFLKSIRDDGITCPAIMVTAKGSIEDKALGYKCGVDDYMVKPINFDELFLRMKAVMRRAKIVNDKKIVIGKTVLDYETLTVYDDKNTVLFAKKEFQILYKLLSYPEHSFSKSQLFSEFWEYDSDTEEDAVKVYINKIRNKIAVFDSIDIETVRGIGYRGIKNEKGNL